MKKIINNTVLIIFLVWAIYFGYQFITKFNIANKIVENEVAEFNSVDFNVLVERIGRGYEYKVVKVGNQKYWLGRIVLPPGAVSKTTVVHIGRPQLVVSKSESIPKDIRVVQVCGYVDYANFFPFGYFKLGIPWVAVITRDN